MTYLGKKYLHPTVDRDQFLLAFPNSYGRKSLRRKIILKGLNRLDACLDADGEIIPGIPTLIVWNEDIGVLKLLLAILNSQAAMFYIRERYSGSSYNGGITFTKEMINDLPIPMMTPSDREELIRIVDRVLAARKNDTTTAVLERELERRVWELYRIDPVEIHSPAHVGRRARLSYHR